MDYGVIEEILKENYANVECLANVPSLRNVRVSIKTGTQEARAESIEAETDNGRIILYRDVFEKLYGKKNKLMLAQTISHEFWHLFSARFKFYYKLEQIYLGKIKLNRLRQKDVRNFIKEINSISKKKIANYIRDFQKTVPCWTGEYIHEQAIYDSRKPFIVRIRHFEFRGVVEDMFAETYAHFISGVRNTHVLNCFSELLKKIMVLSQSQCNF